MVGSRCDRRHDTNWDGPSNMHLQKLCKTLAAVLRPKKTKTPQMIPDAECRAKRGVGILHRTEILHINAFRLASSWWRPAPGLCLKPLNQLLVEVA
jgi:hypothetical protein